METNVNYTAVGAFVIVLTVLIILAIIWLSAGFETELRKKYLILMNESVSGLHKDGPVEFNGVRVGNIASIQLDKNNPEIVHILISIRDTTPVTQGTRARLDVRALSGAAYILLEDKGVDKRPLVLKEGQPFPIIETKPSIFLRLDSALTELSNSFREINTTLSKLLDDENLRNFKETLGNTAKASREFYPFFTSSTRVFNSGNRLFQSGSKTVHSFESQTLPNANQVLQDFSDITSRVKQNPSILLRGPQAPALGPGE